MYQALYRKYRPSTFSEVVGQEHITKTLKNQLSSGRIFHAYLFTGTRGTGKTSCAKILAKAVNCLSPKNGDPCGECESCRAIAAGEVMDISEIDAASNNRVEDVRALREQVNFTPAKAKYRVYIIDEVHMLTTSAFNALLKTLEEPPAHVVFVLATTEVHKLPATIISRCERFDFRRIEPENICERLQQVSAAEGISLNEDAARLIAAAADGGMRDALSVLDLCAAAGGEITEQTVSSICGMAGKDSLFAMAEAINNKDAVSALKIIDRVHAEAADVSRFISELISHFRDLMMIKTVPGGDCPVVCTAAELSKLRAQAEIFSLEEILRALTLLSDSMTRMASANRKTEAEMTAVRLCTPQLIGDVSSLEVRISEIEKQLASGNFMAKAVEPKKVIAEKSEEPEEEIPLPEDEYAAPPEQPALEPEPAIETVSESEDQPFKQWNEVLDAVRPVCPLIVGVLGGSKAYIRGDSLLIDCENPQFRSMLGSNPIYRSRIKEAAAKITGKQFRLGPYDKKPTKTEQRADPLAALAKKLDSLANEVK